MTTAGATWDKKPQGLQELKKTLRQKYEARVGIFSENNKRDDGKSNAMIGLKHIYALETPKRDWLKLPILLKSRDIADKIVDFLPSAIRAKTMKNVYQAMAIEGEQIVKGAFDTGGYGMWLPLSPITADKKGSDTILVETGQLKDSVSSKTVLKV